jgi:hypothetical protein
MLAPPRGYDVIASLYGETLSAGPLGLGSAPGRRLVEPLYASWIQPEVAVRTRDAFSLQGTDPEDTPRATHTREDLVKSYIAVRQASYIEQGTAYFREGQYRDAHNVFMTADSISLDADWQAARVRLLTVFSGIASQQYAQAIKSLAWFLMEDPSTNVRPDPAFLNLVDVSELYADDRLYDSHLEALELQVIQSSESIELQSLYAFGLWQHRADSSASSNGLFRAERIARRADATPPWSGLYDAMLESNRAREAERIRESSARAGSAGGGRLPWELPVNAEGEETR